MKGVSVCMSEQLAKNVLQMDFVTDEKHCAMQACGFSLSSDVVVQQLHAVHNDQVLMTSSERSDVERFHLSSAERKNSAECNSKIMRLPSLKSSSATARKATDVECDVPGEGVAACSYEDLGAADRETSRTHLNVSVSCSNTRPAELQDGPCCAEDTLESDNSWRDSPLLLTFNFPSGNSSTSANSLCDSGIASTQITKLKMLGHHVRGKVCFRITDVPSCTEHSAACLDPALYANKCDGNNDMLAAVPCLAFTPVSVEISPSSDNVNADVHDRSNNQQASSTLNDGTRVNNVSGSSLRQEVDDDELSFREESCNILKVKSAFEMHVNSAAVTAEKLSIVSHSSKNKGVGCSVTRRMRNKGIKCRGVPITAATELHDIERTASAAHGDNLLLIEGSECAEAGDFAEAVERLSSNELNERALTCCERTIDASGLASMAENNVDSQAEVTAGSMFENNSNMVCSSSEVPCSQPCLSASATARKKEVETSCYNKHSFSQRIKKNSTLGDSDSATALWILTAGGSADYCSVKENVPEKFDDGFDPISGKQNFCRTSKIASSGPHTVKELLADTQTPTFAAISRLQREHSALNSKTPACETSLSSVTCVQQVEQTATRKCSFVKGQIRHGDEMSRDLSKMSTGKQVPVLLPSFRPESAEVTVEKYVQLSAFISSENALPESFAKRKLKVSEPSKSVILESLEKRTHLIFRQLDLDEFLGESSTEENLRDNCHKKKFNRSNKEKADKMFICSPKTPCPDSVTVTHDESLLANSLSTTKKINEDNPGTVESQSLSNKASNTMKTSNPLHNIWSDRPESAPVAISRKNAGALTNPDTLKLQAWTIDRSHRRPPKTSTTQHALSLQYLNPAAAFHEKTENAVESAYSVPQQQQTMELNDCENCYSEPLSVDVRKSSVTYRPLQRYECGSFNPGTQFTDKRLRSVSSWENVTTPPLGGDLTVSNCSLTQPLVPQDTTVCKGRRDLSSCSPFSLRCVLRDKNRANVKISEPLKTIAATDSEQRLEVVLKELTGDKRKDVSSLVDANATCRNHCEGNMQPLGHITVDSYSQKHVSTVVEYPYQGAHGVSQIIRTQLPLDSQSLLTRTGKSSMPADPMARVRLNSEISPGETEVPCLGDGLCTTPASLSSFSQSFSRRSCKTLKVASGTSGAAVAGVPAKAVSNEDEIHTFVNDERQSPVKSKPKISDFIGNTMSNRTNVKTTEIVNEKGEVNSLYPRNRFSHSAVIKVLKASEPNEVISSEISAGRDERHDRLFDRSNKNSSPNEKMLEQGLLGNGDGEKSAVGFVKSSCAEVIISHFEEAE